MKTHVVKTTPDASLAEAVDLMDIYQVNSLPVVDTQGKLCGFIAEEDICRGVLVLRERANEADPDVASVDAFQAYCDLGTMPVADYMRKSVVSVSEDADVASAASSIFVNAFTRLPVTAATGEVVGTLNRIDILQAMFEQTLGTGET